MLSSAAGVSLPRQVPLAELVLLSLFESCPATFHLHNPCRPLLHKVHCKLSPGPFWPDSSKLYSRYFTLTHTLLVNADQTCSGDRLLAEITSVFAAFGLSLDGTSIEDILANATRRRDAYAVNRCLEIVKSLRTIPQDFSFWRLLIRAQKFERSPSFIVPWVLEFLAGLRENPARHRDAMQWLARAVSARTWYENRLESPAFDALETEARLIRRFQRASADRRDNEANGAHNQALGLVKAQIGHCEDFLKHVSRFRDLVEDDSYRDFERHPPERMTLLLGPRFRAPEEWQRELYAEMMAEEAIPVESLPPGIWPSEAPSIPPAKDIPALESSAAEGGLDALSSLLRQEFQQTRGPSLAEARFRNWAEINNLLVEADGHERELAEGIAAGKWVSDADRTRWRLLAKGKPMGAVPGRDDDDAYRLKRDMDIYAKKWAFGEFYPSEKSEWKALVRRVRPFDKQQAALGLPKVGAPNAPPLTERAMRTAALQEDGAGPNAAPTMTTEKQ